MIKNVHVSLIFSVLINHHGPFCIEDQIEGLFAGLQSPLMNALKQMTCGKTELKELIDGMGA